MNLKDRITLLKGGYSKKEIEALVEAENKIEEPEVKEPEAKEPVEETKEPSTYEDVMKALIDEVKELKNVVYEKNINSVEISKPVNIETEAEKVLASLINPFNNKEE